MGSEPEADVAGGRDPRVGPGGDQFPHGGGPYNPHLRAQIVAAADVGGCGHGSIPAVGLLGVSTCGRLGAGDAITGGQLSWRRTARPTLGRGTSRPGPRARWARTAPVGRVVAHASRIV